MSKRCLRVALRGSALLVMTILLACTRGGRLTDTGFVGTWERSLEHGFSSLSIRQDGGSGYGVRWSRMDGDLTVRCEPTGDCEEFLGERKVCDWRIRAFTRPDSKDLFIEVVGTPVDDRVPAVRYVDRLVLQAGGTELLSYSIERSGLGGEPTGGPLVFRKISDQPL